MTLPNIGLLGAKRSGKNTVADYLTEKYGYAQLAFADPMRAMARAINPIIVNDGLSPCRYADVVDEHGYDLAKELYPEVRRFLQVLGTEAVRNVLGKDTWIKHLGQRVEELVQSRTPFVVTDVRFPNEFDTLDWRAVMWRVYRPGLDSADTHVSETALDDWDVDTTLINNGSIEDLHARIEDVLHGKDVQL